MFSTTLAVALIGAVQAEAAGKWHHDYGQAHAEAQALDKPLFVVFWARTSHDAHHTRHGQFVSQRVEEILRTSYVRVTVDTSVEEGRRIAERFEADKALHVVILDRSGKWQVFHHAGSITEVALAAALTEHRRTKLSSDGRAGSERTTPTHIAATARQLPSKPAGPPAKKWVIEVNESDFERLVIDGSRERTVVVDFWAEWCGPCRTLMPMLERMAQERGGEFVLAKVNIDHAQSLAARYGVSAVPAVKTFHRGKPTEGFVGVLPEAELREFLDRARLSTPGEVAMQLNRP